MWNRQLRKEAEAFCGPSQVVKVRENLTAMREKRVPAWDVLVKDASAKRGKVVVTLVDVESRYYFAGQVS